MLFRSRLLCGILASHPIFAVMTGDASLRRRPMRRVTQPLAACGARFAAREGGALPLAVEGAREALPLDYRVPVPSAQVKSAVLLCGLNARGATRVEEPEATRDHSENMLRHFGATVNVAARLENQCCGGEVIVSEAVAREAETAAALMDRTQNEETAMLRGVSAPVRFVRIMGRH